MIVMRLDVFQISKLLAFHHRFSIKFYGVKLGAYSLSSIYFSTLYENSVSGYYTHAQVQSKEKNKFFIWY
jgi:hypothetical protein